MNTFQATSVATLDKKEKLFNGIVVKLSTLNAAEISLKDILSIWKGQIIIDAEYDRLDHWLQSQLLNFQLDEKYLSQLIFTIQVKRADAFEQIKYFTQMGLNVVLVRGHNNYFQDVELNQNAINVFAEMIMNYDNIVYLGISNNTKRKIETINSIKIKSSRLLELYGSQKNRGSAMWTYFTDNILSDEAKAFVDRRINSNKKIIIQKIDDLYYLEGHSVYLYIDINSKKQYLQTLHNLNLF